MNKMILVPHDIAGRDDISAHMSNLDREMHKILSNKSLPVDQKIIHYNQILHQYRRLTDEQTKPYQLELVDQPPPLASTEADKPLEVENSLVQNIPAKWRKQANLLLQNAQKNPYMKWSENGEMIIDGNKIVGSNIEDLINDFSRESRVREPAIGAEIFLKNLLKANIPRHHIVNRKRFELASDTLLASPQTISTSAGRVATTTPVQGAAM